MTNECNVSLIEKLEDQRQGSDDWCAAIDRAIKIIMEDASTRKDEVCSHMTNHNEPPIQAYDEILKHLPTKPDKTEQPDGYYHEPFRVRPSSPMRESGWQPIETAPKDEIDCGYDGLIAKRFVAWDKQWDAADNAVVAYWDIDHWQVYGRDDATTHFKPTHWMPLPKPPTRIEGGTAK